MIQPSVRPTLHPVSEALVSSLSAVLIVMFVFLGTSLSQSQSDTVTAKLLNAASGSTTLESNLRYLTDAIGGRVPGTRAMDQAVEWSQQAFRNAGSDHVYTEEFVVPMSWSEGNTELWISSPAAPSRPAQTQFKTRAVSIAWGPPLSRTQDLVIADVGFGSSREFAEAGDVAGKLLLVHSKVLSDWDDLFSEYTSAPSVIERAVSAKALAIAFIASREHDILYRHTNSKYGEIERLPMVIVAREDGERIARLLKMGQQLRAELSIPNKVAGPVKTKNVIAEITGRETPKEFVVLGAHLDSWDLGTGALDNGCNAAMVIDAVRAVKASGVTPRRTIRFILFGAEEEGLLGSRAYVEAHRAELDQYVGVVIFDTGSGETTGFSLGGRKDVFDRASALVAPLKTLGADLLTTDATWGTDNFDFMLQGVPTFMANQRESNYLVNYHATSDTFDKVDLQELQKQVAEATVLTVGLADMNGRVGARLTRAEIERTLEETHVADQMRGFGMWRDWESGRLGARQ